MRRIIDVSARPKDRNMKNGSTPGTTSSSRRRLHTLALATLVLMVFALPASAQNSGQRTKSAESGSALTLNAGKTFAATCAACHGLDGRGGERGPDLATRPEVVRRSDAELLKALRDGKPTSGMPSFAALGDAKLSAMVSYLRALQGKNASAPVSGDPHHGESLFFGKARCSECHSVNGKGGFIGSELSDYAVGSSAAEVKNSLLNPDIDAKQSRSKTQVSLQDGKSWQGIIRNEDNFSLQLQSLDGVFHLIQKSEVVELKSADQLLMPDDYGKVLSPSELDDLVGYLMTVARANPGAVRRNRRHRRE